MTTDALQQEANRSLAIAGQWTARASALIGTRVDRAHAHAVVALTETLRDTPDGRRTLRKASQSRSYESALADLADLHDRLTGPSVASLDGLLRDARADLYATAFAGWLNLYPVAFVMPADSKPTVARLNEMRGLVLHGTELRREIGGRIDVVKRELLATIEQASRRGHTNPHSADLLDGWKTRTTTTLTLASQVAISDSMVAIGGIAGVDTIRPEFRPKNEFTP